MKVDNQTRRLTASSANDTSSEGDDCIENATKFFFERVSEYRFDEIRQKDSKY